jgi:hypothetical protein
VVAGHCSAVYATHDTAPADSAAAELPHTPTAATAAAFMAATAAVATDAANAACQARRHEQLPRHVHHWRPAVHIAAKQWPHHGVGPVAEQLPRRRAIRRNLKYTVTWEDAMDLGLHGWVGSAMFKGGVRCIRIQDGWGAMGRCER